MKKRYIIVIAILVLAGAGGFCVWNGVNTKENASTTKPVPIQDLIHTPPFVLKYATTTLPKDFSVLERDTIYGEEEGKFVNLPSEGQALLISLIAIPGCDTNPNGAYCDENDQLVESGSIVAFKNNILLYSVASLKGSTLYNTHNIHTKATTSNTIVMTSNDARSNSYIAMSEFRDQSLIYYKPGMISMKRVPGSELHGNEFYTRAVGLADYVDISFISENMMRVSIFDHTALETNGYSNQGPFKKKREVTFDLNILP